MPKIYFIIGVNGIGKSSIIPYVRSALADKNFGVYDFDERGVPDNADGNWRRSETLHWLEIGKEDGENGVSTIVCGFSKPEEIQLASEEVHVPVSVILLDADSETITGRILGRYLSPESIAELERTTGKTPEKFASDNVWVSSKFREAAAKSGYKILDTTNLSPEEVAQKVVELVNTYVEPM